MRADLITDMADILLLNGPNLNLLGRREPSIYGVETLQDIEASLIDKAANQGATLQCFQSNAEHELVAAVQNLLDRETAAVIINPGAFTHTSLALRDAFAAVNVPFYEVHISNVHQREAYRSRSYLADLAAGVICGLGVAGYQVALTAALSHVSKTARAD